MAVRQKVIDPRKCDACFSRVKVRRTMRLCKVCYNFVDTELQAQIVSGYDTNFDASWKQPPEEWNRLVQKAVDQALKAQPPPKKPVKAVSSLQCFDSNKTEIHEQDKVMMGNVRCIVLGLAGENMLRLRTLTHPPDIQTVAASDVTIIREEFSELE